jgi:cytochrome c biogenesis protein CcmG/thiol:disulfide interchange protein DsbE
MAARISRFLRLGFSARLVAGLACLLLFLLLACGGASAGAARDSKLAFRLKTTDGRTLGPPDFPGQVVVVDFWATWCAPCRIQARILEPVVRDLQGHGVQFLAADMAEPEDTVRGFLKENPFPYPVLLDTDGKISDDLGITALPTLLVVDKKGGLRYLQPGLADGDTIKRIIREAGG